MKWEYKLLTSWTADAEFIQDDEYDLEPELFMLRRFEKTLNEIGNDGWELVSVDRKGERIAAWLKREKRHSSTQ